MIRAGLAVGARETVDLSLKQVVIELVGLILFQMPDQIGKAPTSRRRQQLSVVALIKLFDVPALGLQGPESRADPEVPVEKRPGPDRRREKEQEGAADQKDPSRTLHESTVTGTAKELNSRKFASVRDEPRKELPAG